MYGTSHECAREISARVRLFGVFVSFCSKLRDEMDQFNSLLVPNKDILSESANFALQLNIFIFSSHPQLLNMLLAFMF